MHENRTWIHQVLFSFFILLGISGADQTLAAVSDDQAQNLLQQIHEARLQAYLIMTDYYNFSANVGDKELLGSIHSGQSRMDGLVTDLNAQNDSPGYLAAMNHIHESWLSYKSLLARNISDIERLGYHELQLVSQLAQSNVDMGIRLERLYDLVLDQFEVRPSEVVEYSRVSALTMAVMMTKYSARSTSNISQIFQGEDPGDTLDVLAKNFDRSLAVLMEAKATDKEAVERLKKAHLKWNFIRDSYVNYNENNVNFVVNLYSRQIIESLGTSSTELQNS